MNVLALDLGTTTGWALRAAGVVASGSQSFKPGRFDGGGMRYLKFRKWLDTLKEGETIHAVYFEEVRRHMGVDAAHAYGGFLATLTSWCELHQIPYEGIPVGTIKKHATGSGAAKKEAMIEAALNMFDAVLEIADDNHADAVALLHYAVTVLHPSPKARRRKVTS